MERLVQLYDKQVTAMLNIQYRYYTIHVHTPYTHIHIHVHCTYVVIFMHTRRLYPLSTPAQCTYKQSGLGRNYIVGSTSPSYEPIVQGHSGWMFRQ